MRAAVLSLSNQLGNALTARDARWTHLNTFVYRYQVPNLFYAEQETRAEMTEYLLDFHFHFRAVSCHGSLYGGRVVAGPRPLDPFLENRTQMGCAVSFVGCLGTREWLPRAFKWFAEVVHLANGRGRVLSPYEG